MLRLLGQLAVEADVAAAAQQPGAGDHHRRVVGPGRVERADEVGVEHLGGPVDAQRASRAVQALYVARVGRRQGAEQSDAGVDHQRGGAEAGEQRDLRVPGLDRQHRAELQAPAAVLVDDLLLGQRQRHPAARRLAGQPQLADLAQEREHLVGGAGVELGLDARRIDSLARDLTRARSTVTSVPSPVASTLILHTRAGRTWSGSSEPASSEIDRRVQRDLGVGAVEGLAAAVGLHVDRVAGRDERREVGDGVVHDEAVAGALEMHRLVEVHRRRRVDGHERQVGQVEVRQSRVGGGLRRPPARRRRGSPAVTFISAWMAAIPSRRISRRRRRSRSCGR